MIVNNDVFALIKSNFERSMTKPIEIKPFVFFTDGGVYQDHFEYFMHKIFEKGTTLYSSKYLNAQQRLTGVHL